MWRNRSSQTTRKNSRHCKPQQVWPHTMRDFNFRWAESLSTFTQWKQAAEC